jgi:phage gp29-like protein
MSIKALLSDHFATRARSLDFTAFGLLLPNPDPILKAQGRDIEVYRDLRTDALVGGSIRRRKSAVKSLEWGIDRGQAASRTSKSIQSILDDLDLERITGQILEATLYGYQPMEVMWKYVGGVLVPDDVVAKPPEWFCFDPENNLRFKTRQNPVFGELLPERKFLLPRQDPTYKNPYGFPDLSMCFWPLAFKKGGLKFWLSFTEKFGSAWPVGKLPRAATDQERAELLDSLDALIQDGSAVIPDDGSIEIKEMAGKAASADLYEKLVLHCRSEISIALLGQNQTTESSANRASASAGLEVTKDLRDGDAEIVAATINQLIRWICEANWASSAPPVFSMWDQQSRDKLQADRDKSNYEAGARFTNAYWQRSYGYIEGDLAPDTAQVAPVPAATFASFADSSTATDPTKSQTDLLMEATKPSLDSMIGSIQALVNRSDSFLQVQQELVKAYASLDSAELEKIMAAAFALAELKGMVDAQSGSSS